MTQMSPKQNNLNARSPVPGSVGFVLWSRSHLLGPFGKGVQLGRSAEKSKPHWARRSHVPLPASLGLWAQFPTLTPQALPPQAKLGDKDRPPCLVPVPTLCPPRPGWPPLSSRLGGHALIRIFKREESQKETQKRPFFRAVVLSSFWMEC